MQENKFEKDIQEQMGGLNFRPSPEVWEKVEEELRKKKRRRFALLFFSLAGILLLGYGGYQFLVPVKPSTRIATGDNNTNDADNRDNKSQRVSLAEKDLPAKISSPATTSARSTDKDNAASTDHHSSSTPVGEKVMPTAIPKNTPFPGKPANTPATVVVNEKTPNIRIAPVEPLSKTKKRRPVSSSPTGITPYSSTGNIVDNDNPVPSTVTGTKTTTTTINELRQPGDDSIKASISVAIVPVTTTIDPVGTATIDSLGVPGISDHIANAASILSRAHRLKIGLEYSAGLSDRSSKSVPFVNSDKTQNANFSSPGNVSGPSAGLPGPPLAPSSVRAGLAFHAGIVAAVPLSKRSSISAALEYAYRSDHIKTGEYTASNIAIQTESFSFVQPGAVYQGAQTKNYVNRYHFLTIPIRYELQLTNGKRFPAISWNVGASASYLLSSSMLTYDTSATGIYYKNKSLINRLHMGMSTGFAFRLGNKHGLQWSLGPELSVNMTPLMTRSFDSKQYLLYGGIAGRFFLSRKKK